MQNFQNEGLLCKESKTYDNAGRRLSFFDTSDLYYTRIPEVLKEAIQYHGGFSAGTHGQNFDFYSG